jgi:NTE family protein
MVCGTSVGAINACHLAAHASDPTYGVRRLVELWRNIRLDDILGLTARHVISVPRVLTGGLPDGAGLFNVGPISDLVRREVPWRAITENLAKGHLGLLSVSTTEVSTGRTVIFMQTGPRGALPSTAPPRTVLRGDVIGPPHALASAAIPILFPPVRIGGDLYVDGGVRQNTPIAPSLRAGATHVFAIGLSKEERGIRDGGASVAMAPGAAFLIGKLLNAVLLDHIDADIDLLRRMNSVLEDGARAYGADFNARLTEAARARGGTPYRHVEHAVIRPSGRTRSGSVVVRRMLKLLDVGVGTESDLVSYLLFDGAFASRLIDLGRADAAARRDKLLAFFDGDDNPGDGDGDGGEPHEPHGWTMPPPVVG